MHVDAEALEGQRELIIGAAVQGAGGHHFIAGLQQRRQRHQLRGLAGRRGQAADAAFERRDAFFEGGSGWIGDAGIDVAEFVQSEQVRRVLGIFEYERGRLVNRHGAGAGGGVRRLPGVQHASVESKIETLVHKS